MKKNENKPKRGQVWPIKKTKTFFCASSDIRTNFFQLFNLWEMKSRFLPKKFYNIDNSGQSYKQFTMVIYESRVKIWAIF